MTRYCIYCGRSDSEENPVVNNVCLDCLLKRGEAVVLSKKVISIPLCKSCGSIKVGFKWIDTSGFDEAIDYVVKNVLPSYIKTAPGVSNYSITGYSLKTNSSWRTVVEVNITGNYGGKEFTTSIDVVLMFKPTKCPRCVMYDSREFDAVIQIRGFNRSKVASLVNNLLNKDIRITRDLIDIIESSNGVDLYFYGFGSARKLARKLASQLKAHVIESHEEAGMRSGKKRTRLYISLKPV